MMPHTPPDADATRTEAVPGHDKTKHASELRAGDAVVLAHRILSVSFGDSVVDVVYADGLTQSFEPGAGVPVL
jgi:hypothetical protein